MSKKVKVGQKYWLTRSLYEEPIEVVIIKTNVEGYYFAADPNTDEIIYDRYVTKNTLVDAPYGPYFSSKKTAETDNEYFSLIIELRDTVMRGVPKKLPTIEDIKKLKITIKEFKKMFNKADDNGDY